MSATKPKFDIQCEWGINGIHHLAPQSDVIIIVDVLSFSTSVDVAVSQGVAVYPYGGPIADAAAYARQVDALLASRRTIEHPSLSPQSMQNLSAINRLVLPSLNGSACAFAAESYSGEGLSILTACLRNAPAVADKAQQLGERIAVIPAGERWKSDRSLRPALEDWIGAGAVIAHLSGDLSPEAASAVKAFDHARADLLNTLAAIESGRELIEKGFLPDVEMASQYAVSVTTPVLDDKAFKSI